MHIPKIISDSHELTCRVNQHVNWPCGRHATWRARVHRLWAQTNGLKIDSCFSVNYIRPRIRDASAILTEPSQASVKKPNYRLLTPRGPGSPPGLFSTQGHWDLVRVGPNHNLPVAERLPLIPIGHSESLSTGPSVTLSSAHWRSLTWSLLKTSASDSHWRTAHSKLPHDPALQTAPSKMELSGLF